MLRQTFTSTLPAVVLLLTLAGCGKEEAAPAPTASTEPDPRMQIDRAVRNRGMAMGTYTREFERSGVRLQTLKSAAATVGDEQLDALIEAIGEKLAAAGPKLEALETVADADYRAVQVEFKILLLEANNLTRQATERLAALKAAGG